MKKKANKKLITHTLQHQKQVFSKVQTQWNNKNFRLLNVQKIGMNEILSWVKERKKENEMIRNKSYTGNEYSKL